MRQQQPHEPPTQWHQTDTPGSDTPTPAPSSQGPAAQKLSTTTNVLRQLVKITDPGFDSRREKTSKQKNSSHIAQKLIELYSNHPNFDMTPNKVATMLRDGQTVLQDHILHTKHVLNQQQQQPYASLPVAATEAYIPATILNDSSMGHHEEGPSDDIDYHTSPISHKSQFRNKLGPVQKDHHKRVKKNFDGALSPKKEVFLSMQTSMLQRNLDSQRQVMQASVTEKQKFNACRRKLPQAERIKRPPSLRASAQNSSALPPRPTVTPHDQSPYVSAEISTLLKTQMARRNKRRSLQTLSSGHLSMAKPPKHASLMGSNPPVRSLRRASQHGRTVGNAEIRASGRPNRKSKNKRSLKEAQEATVSDGEDGPDQQSLQARPAQPYDEIDDNLDMEIGDYDDDNHDYEQDYMEDPIGEDCSMTMASPKAEARHRDGVDSAGLLDDGFEDNEEEI